MTLVESSVHHRGIFDGDEHSLEHISDGRGSAFGHHGEVLQGVFEDEHGLHRGLVTLPCRAMKSTATFHPNRTSDLSINPGDRTKALNAARLFLQRCFNRDVGGIITIRSNIPVGFGFGSSTSDVIATVRALADATSCEVSPEEMAQIAVAAELASDATMFGSQAVLFAQREGRVLEYYGRSLPPLHILSINTEPEKPIDTVLLSPARYTREEIESFRPLRALIKRAVSDQDASLVGSVATASAIISERRLPHRDFIEIRTIGERCRAVGIQVSHSGTLVGLLFDARTSTSARQLHEAQSELAGFGLSSVIYSAR